MVKFKVEFENRVPTYTLIFRDKEFSYSMNQTFDYGISSDKPVFSEQLSKAFSDLSIEKLEDEINIDMLACSLYDEDELFEILDELQELE